jgi:hypothetical protein
MSRRQKFSERRGNFVSDQLFDLKMPDEAYTDMVPVGKRAIVCVTYLSAIGLAMIGWLWLIAWCMLWLV